ncbi:MAG: hypothetical protein EZS28_041976, partial [Streblomastix strix]
MDQLYFWTENPFVLEQNYLNVAAKLVNDDGIPDVEEEKVKRVFLTVFPDQSELMRQIDERAQKFAVEQHSEFQPLAEFLELPKNEKDVLGESQNTNEFIEGSEISIQQHKDVIDKLKLQFNREKQIMQNRLILLYDENEHLSLVLSSANKTSLRLRDIQKERDDDSQKIWDNFKQKQIELNTIIESKDKEIEKFKDQKEKDKIYYEKRIEKLKVDIEDEQRARVNDKQNHDRVLEQEKERKKRMEEENNAILLEREKLKLSREEDRKKREIEDKAREEQAKKKKEEETKKFDELKKEYDKLNQEKILRSIEDEERKKQEFVFFKQIITQFDQLRRSIDTNEGSQPSSSLAIDQITDYKELQNILSSPIVFPTALFPSNASQSPSPIANYSQSINTNSQQSSPSSQQPQSTSIIITSNNINNIPLRQSN